MRPKIARISPILLLLFTGPAFAQISVELDARPSSTLIDLGETLNIEVLVTIRNGELPRNHPIVTSPDPENVVIGTPGGGSPRVQQTSIINNVRTSYYEIIFIYPITFKSPGRYRFADIRLDYMGNRYRLAENKGFEVTVTAPEITYHEPVATEPVQVFARLDKQRIYRGEMVVLSIVAYSHYPITEPPVFNITGTFDGFYSERVIGDSSVSREKVNGTEFYVRPAHHRFALFPIGHGMQRIPSIDVGILVETVEERQDFFRGTVRQRVHHNVRRRTRPVYLEVKPLPEEGKPDHFSGLVGDLSLQSGVSDRNVIQGEGIGFRIRVEGQADFSRRWQPELPDLTAFSVHDPEVSQTTRLTDGKLTGTKVFAYPLVPLATGEQVIGPVRLSVFNPRLEEYQVLETPPIPIRIEPSDRPPTIWMNIGRNAVVEINPLEVDFRYIHDDPNLLAGHRDRLAENPLFLSAHALPIILLGGAMVFRKHRIRLRTDESYARSMAAPKRTRKALAEASRLETPEQAHAFHAALARAVLELLEGRFHVPAKGLTQDALRETLIRKGLPEETTGEVIGFLSRLDEARFAGTGIEIETMKREREQAQDLVSRLMKVTLRSIR